MHELFDVLVNSLVLFIDKIGYAGIFIGMFLESTIFPIPSEVIMIPAGIAAAQGLMNIYIATLVGVLGNIAGAIFCYYLAKSVGRKILFKIGKYFFVKEETIIKIEKFFKSHGPISVFIGRLIPGFRHFISLPAGVARMDIKLFIFYTTIGSAIWTSILSGLGFVVGRNQELIGQYAKEATIGAVVFCVVLVVGYIIWKRK